MLRPIFAMEKIVRISNDTKNLEYGTDSLIALLFSMFAESVNNHRDLDDDFKDMILAEFDKALKSARNIYIEKSFKDGVDKSINFLIEFLEAIIKTLNNRGYNIKAAIEWQRFTMGA